MIRYGIIGCSGVGTTHADGVVQTVGAELVAAADLSGDARREFADTYDCDAYEDHVEMIRNADLDAVSICTPSGTHADVAVSSLETGVNVLCEKPLDVTLERVDRILEAAESSDGTLSGIFQRRLQPGPKRAKEVIDAGELGDVVLADVAVKWYRTQEYYDQADWRGTYDMDGGVLMNQAIHGIDLLSWLVGDVKTVDAELRTLARDIEVEDTAVINLEFENGALGQIEATTVTQPEHPVSLEVNGESGSLRLRDAAIDRFETADGPVSADVTADEWDEYHAAQIEAYVDALEAGTEPPFPAREAQKAVDVVFAAYESDARGEPVDVAELRD